MNLGALKLALILFGLSLLLKFQAWRHPAFRERLKEKNLTGQFIAKDEEIGRWFKIAGRPRHFGLGRAAMTPTSPSPSRTPRSAPAC